MLSTVPGVGTDGINCAKGHQQLQILPGLQGPLDGRRRAAAGWHAALQAAWSPCNGLPFPKCHQRMRPWSFVFGSTQGSGICNMQSNSQQRAAVNLFRTPQVQSSGSCVLTRILEGHMTAKQSCWQDMMHMSS